MKAISHKSLFVSLSLVVIYTIYLQIQVFRCPAELGTRPALHDRKEKLGGTISHNSMRGKMLNYSNGGSVLSLTTAPTSLQNNTNGGSVLSLTTAPTSLQNNTNGGSVRSLTTARTSLQNYTNGGLVRSLTTAPTSLLNYTHIGPVRSLTTAPTSLKGSRCIIYTCTGGCGGFGDRLKGMVNAYLWALVTNRTLKFVLKHPCPNFLHGLLRPNLVQWNTSFPSTKVPFMLNLMDKFAFRRTILRGDLEKLYPHEVIVLRSNVHYWTAFTKVPHYKVILQNHGFSDLSARGIFAKAFGDLFTWSPNLRAGLPPYKSGPLICLQVRMGGSSKSMSFDTPRRNMNSVYKQFRSLKKHINIFPTFKLFVTTDSEEVKEVAHLVFGSSYFDTPGEITHTDRSSPGRACAGMEKVISDFYFLSQCDYLQVSRSGFGILASYLNKNRKFVSMLWKEGVIKGDIPDKFLDLGVAPDY